MTRSSRPHRAARKTGRKLLTRDMLLPLPIVRVRAMSLEHHLALVAMRSGSGNVDQMSCLLKVVYLTYFMRGTQQDQCEIEVFRAAEAALERSAARARCNDGWSLQDDDCAVLERILALHDRQLGCVPAHVFEAAFEHLQRFLKSDRQSPESA